MTLRSATAAAAVLSATVRSFVLPPPTPSSSVVGLRRRRCSRRRATLLFAKKRNKGSSENYSGGGGDSDWYESIAENATPDDVFWGEMDVQKQKLMTKATNLSGGPDGGLPKRDTGLLGQQQQRQTQQRGGGGGGGGGGVKRKGVAGGSQKIRDDYFDDPRNAYDFEMMDRQEQLRLLQTPQQAEAALTAYEAHMVSDNFLSNPDEEDEEDDEKHLFVWDDGTPVEDDDWGPEEQQRAIDREYAEAFGDDEDEDDSLWEDDEDDEDDGDEDFDPVKNNLNGIPFEPSPNQKLEPWDTYGTPPKPKEVPRPPDVAVDPDAEAALAARLAGLEFRSPRLEAAVRAGDRARVYFGRPLESTEFDRMWVSAVDEPVFKNLQGLLRNYGVQFADNFGDFALWDDDDASSSIDASIEDLTSAAARRVHEVTGLPCVAGRCSWEVEPARGDLEVGRNMMMTNSPRVRSGYRFNDVGSHVDRVTDALLPYSDPTRKTRFRACLCFYDGEREFREFAECDCDLYFCNSERTFIPMSGAIHEMCKTARLVFGLEFQKWLRERIRESADASGAPGKSGKAALKLRDRVLKEGRVLPNDIIDVSAFMDSMVDVGLMDECGEELAQKFIQLRPSKILTVATTGLVLALPMAKHLQVPAVYARKERNVVMADAYSASYSSRTVGKNRELLVAKVHLSPDDRVLIVDDFLSSGASQVALMRILSESGAEAVGVAVLLEKTYESGREFLSGYGVPVESVVKVTSVQDGIIQMEEEQGFLAS